MNRKLAEEDRRRIHDMLSHGFTHAEIAEELNVCTRTIDREAAWWRAHTADIRVLYRDGRHVLTSIRIGEALEDVDVSGAMAEAERAAKELEALDVSGILEGIDMSEIMREAEASRFIDIPGMMAEIEDAVPTSSLCHDDMI
jgi:orotate phosphoribosyltransferase-like protein